MSQHMSVKTSAETLASAARSATNKGPAPVHLWTPDLSGDIDIRIARDGRWFHEGGEITRPELVRLFASILKREDDDYFLVTPVEKWRIEVENAPFVAVDVDIESQGPNQQLVFSTNTGERVIAGPDHQIRVTIDKNDGTPAPYVHIRAGLHALIDRKSFYRLIDCAEERKIDGASWLGVNSNQHFFGIAPTADLN